jgi:putative tricarboxylic transport membrane protein
MKCRFPWHLCCIIGFKNVTFPPQKKGRKLKGAALRKSERVPAFSFLLFSLFVCQQSVGMGLGTFQQPGSGFLSFSAGAVIGILALWFLIQSTISKGGPGKAGHSGDGERGLPRIRLLLVCLALFGYVFAFDGLGFVLSTFLFVLFVFPVAEPQRWWRVVVKAILITIGNYVVFVVWLGVNLPKGVLGW